MEKLTQLFKSKERTFSFELFPPKTDQGYLKLQETIGRLADLKPDFISVTYGAGGSNRDKTIDLVDCIQSKHHIIGLAHLTCVVNTKAEIKTILTEIKNRKIANVLALRGDAPKDNPDWKPGKDNFHYSFELCQFIKQEFKDHFTVGVAGFPEGHILCPDKNQDAKYLKMKIDAGADFVITQLFFENQDYFDYVARLRKLGVTKRIIPGIVPITDFTGIVNFCKSCGASVPKKVYDIFEPIKDNKEATLKAGIDYAIKQCRELLSKGAPGIHFYPLNKVHPIDVILPAIRS